MIDSTASPGMQNRPPPHTGESAIRAEQINLLYQQALPGLLGGLIVGIITCLFLSPHTDHRLFLYSWLGSFIAITCLRGLLVLFFCRSRPTATECDRWGTMYTCMAFFSGLCWGLLVVIWEPSWPVSIQLLFFTVLTGIAAGAISSNGVYLPAYITFILPMFLPVMLLMLFRGEATYSGLSALFLLYTIVLSATARNYSRSLTKSLLLGTRNQRLVDELSQSNRNLQQEIGERQQAETQLKALNSTLKQQVASRTEELQTQFDYLEKVIDSIPHPFYVVDLDSYIIVTANKATGMKPGTTCHKASFQKDIPCHEEGYPCPLAEIKRTGAPVILEQHRPGQGGKGLFFQIRAYPLFDERGKVVQMLEHVINISAHKQLEVELQTAHRLESIGQLAAGIAHEINTPMQYVQNNVAFFERSFKDFSVLLTDYQQLLDTSETPLTNEAREHLENISIDFLIEEIPESIADAQDGINRVVTIVSAMKEFSHPGSDEKTAIDLNHALESTITVSRNEWKYVAEMVTDFDPNLPMVPCLPDQLNQVVLNLIINAAQAIEETGASAPNSSGTLTISTRAENDWVELRVSDSGNGIPENIRDRIFDPFFTTKEVGKGTGQGLAIIHDVVVKKHGGSIDFTTETGQGTTFIIRLPLTVGNSG